ncbi:MAG: hypothetical protein K2N72_10920 [Oscillospiraceae bacterium]|nr:hypothetical protein [Oscillospiraceae bacterium]
MDINELNEQIAKHEKWLDMDFMLKYKNNTFTHENDKANGMLCLENECLKKLNWITNTFAVPAFTVL